MSALVFVAGLGVFILGFATFSNVTFDTQPYARHGSANFEWTLISALLTTGGLLWMLAAFAYMKRRTRAGIWLSVGGFAAFCCGMNVGIPA